MEIKEIKIGDRVCAVIRSDKKVITNTQSALDLLVDVKYNLNTSNIVIDKELITEDFFDLKTKIAGDIFQKYINYGGRLAIYGDYSKYDSKSLKDLMYEMNKGSDIFFACTEKEAIDFFTKNIK